MSAADRRQREREARREAILDAAESIVRAHGFNALTMDLVATHAELSKGALYLYFANKDALCAAIAVRVMHHFLSRLEGQADAPHGLAQVRRIMETYAAFFVERPQSFRFLVEWLLSGNEPEQSSPSYEAYEANLSRIIHLVTQAIDRGKADGTIRDDLNTALLAKQLWGSFLGVFLVQRDDRAIAKRLTGPVDLAALLPLHFDQTVRAIAGPGAREAVRRSLEEAS